MKNRAQEALNCIKDGIIAKSDIDALQLLIDQYQEVTEENAFLKIENKQMLERIKRLEEKC